MTGKTGLTVDGFVFTVGAYALVTAQTVGPGVDLAEVLFAVRGDLQRR